MCEIGKYENDIFIHIYAYASTHRATDIVDQQRAKKKPQLQTNTSSTKLSLTLRVAVHVEAGGHDEVGEDEHESLEVVGGAFLEQHRDHKDGDEESGSLKEVEIEIHVDAHTPPNHHAERNLTHQDWNEGGFKTCSIRERKISG